MVDSLDKVTYGNLNQTNLKQLQSKCLADKVIPILDKKFSNLYIY